MIQGGQRSLRDGLDSRRENLANKGGSQEWQRLLILPWNPLLPSIYSTIFGHLEHTYWHLSRFSFKGAMAATLHSCDRRAEPAGPPVARTTPWPATGRRPGALRPR